MSNTEPTSAMAVPAQNQSAAAQAKLPQPASSSARPRSPGDSAAELSARTNDLKAEATKAAQAVEVKQDRSVALITTVAQELDEAITVLNESLAKTPTRAMISKDETLNRFVVKIADKESGEIVREIPSEALLKFARQLKELKGILFDKHT